MSEFPQGLKPESFVAPNAALKRRSSTVVSTFVHTLASTSPHTSASTSLHTSASTSLHRLVARSVRREK